LLSIVEKNGIIENEKVLSPELKSAPVSFRMYKCSLVAEMKYYSSRDRKSAQFLSNSKKKLLKLGAV
jgi:hypothetical protein